MQIEHKTEKGTVCFVKVPNKAWDFKLTTKGTPAIYFQTGYLEENQYERVIIDSFGWQLMGLTSEVTEEQCQQIFGIDTDKSNINLNLFELHRTISFLHIQESSLILFKPND